MKNRSEAGRRGWRVLYGDDGMAESMSWGWSIPPRLYDEYVNEAAETALMKEQKLDVVLQ